MFLKFKVSTARMLIFFKKITVRTVPFSSTYCANHTESHTGLSTCKPVLLACQVVTEATGRSTVLQQSQAGVNALRAGVHAAWTQPRVTTTRGGSLSSSVNPQHGTEGANVRVHVSKFHIKSYILSRSIFT